MASAQTGSGPSPWIQGVFTRLPWLAFGAFVGSVLCFVAAVIVLVASDSKAADTWTWQPSVYLNILSGVSNGLLSFTFAEAIAIAWWRRATKKNTTITHLHHLWSEGTSPLEAIRGLGRFHWIALCNILSLIAVQANGPLLQRASTVDLVSLGSTAATTLDISPALSEDWATGYINGGRGVIFADLLTPQFAAVAQNFTANTPIHVNSTGCVGTCGPARVPGVGFKVNCSHNTYAFDLIPHIKPGQSLNSDPAVERGFNIFGVYFGWGASDAMSLALGVQYKKTTACAGDVLIQNCTLRVATVEYPVIIDAAQSTIALDPSSTIFDDLVVNVTKPISRYGAPYAIYGGLLRTLSDSYESQATMGFGGAIGYYLTTSGAAALRYANITTPSDSSSCNLSFVDPTNDMLAAARGLMFRTSIAAAQGSNAQTIQMPQAAKGQVFRTHYLFVGLAVGAAALGFLAVGSIFYGYNRLGRSVSLSPVETAKAFGAPLLKHSDSNAQVKCLLRQVGHVPVRYGALRLTRNPPRYQLALYGPNHVTEPKPGQTFAA